MKGPLEQFVILLIDNYDSFTYNLFHLASELGAEVSIHRNDALTPDQAMKMQPEAILLSPGPGAPDQAGICVELVKCAAKLQLPMLGVCLGHQVIASAFGAQILRGSAPVHGKTSSVDHHGQGLFADMPSPLQVTRYHSLVAQNLPRCLKATARTADGTLMALEHRSLPLHGVQFHPESVATEYGTVLMRNFLSLIPNFRILDHGRAVNQGTARECG